MLIYNFEKCPNQCFIICGPEEQDSIPEKFLKYKYEITHNLGMIKWVENEIIVAKNYSQKIKEVKNKYSVYYAAEHLLGGIVGSSHWESDYLLLDLEQAEAYPAKWGFCKIIKNRETFDAPQKAREINILYKD